MTETFLNAIIAATRETVEKRKLATDVRVVEKRALDARRNAQPFAFSSALKQPGTNLIAEIKRASPSKGDLNLAIDIRQLARSYESGGAAAISVLTEERFFKGTLSDLEAVRSVVALPLLRKDFIVDRFQICEAAVAGADAILLIAAVLPTSELREFMATARDLGMDALVEVHTKAEMETAAALGADLIGVNNRDLRTFDVSLDTSRQLARQRPANALLVCESGLSTPEHIQEMRQIGFDAFLVGESLMRSNDVAASLGTLLGGSQ
jgi:indole-3-glycerol phosphate synthase